MEPKIEKQNDGVTYSLVTEQGLRIPLAQVDKASTMDATLVPVLKNPDAGQPPAVETKVASIDLGSSFVSPGGRISLRPTARIASGLIETFKARIITATGAALPAAQEEALRGPLERLMRSTVWPKLQVLWIPMGADDDLASARVCLLEGSGTFSLINDNFVATDYKANKGFDGAANTNKRLRTTFNPATHAAAGGMVSTDWGLGVYMGTYNAAGVCVGTVGNTNAYIGYITSNISNYVSTQVAHISTGGLMSLQYKDGKVQSWYGAYKRAETAANAVSFGSSFSTTFSLFSTNSGFYGSGICQGFAVFSGLSAAEMTILNNFFADVNIGLGRTPNYVTGFGDSITQGTGVVTSSNRWLHRMAAKYTLLVNNQGAAGRAISTAGGAGGVFALETNNTNGYIMTVLRNISALNVMALGLNDTYIQPNLNIATIETDFNRMIDNLVLAGIRPEHWMLCAPYWAPGSASTYISDANQQSIAAIIRATALRYDMAYCDLLNGRLRNQSAAGWDAPGVHPDDSMHALIVADMYDALAEKWSTIGVPGMP